MLNQLVMLQLQALSALLWYNSDSLNIQSILHGCFFFTFI